MSFLDNLSIKGKLVLLLILPILGFIIVTLIQGSQAYERLQTMEKIDKVAVLATKISALVHETQKERGMTAGYLGSKGKKFKDKLPSQRELSNTQFKNLTAYIKEVNFADYPVEFKKKMDDAISRFNGLSKIRPDVDSFKIPAPKAISYYTVMNGLMLDNIVSIAKLSNDAKITQELTSYSSFLLSKERAGIERAVGSNTLGRDSFSPGMREKLNNLISAQDSFMKTFIYYANDDWKKFYNTTVSGKPIDEVSRIRKIMLGATEVGGFGISAEYWFDTITKKINLLKSVENYMRDNLYIEDSDLKEAVQIASRISNLLHETQKERGATAGFIGSKGTKFITKLPNQRKLTDGKIVELKKILEDIEVSYFTPDFQDNLKGSLSKLEELSNMREKVSSLSIPAKGAIAYYTSMNAQFLDTIASVVRMATIDSETKDLNSFYNFLMSKERAGIERAVLSNSFARNKFLPGMKRKFIVLMTEQSSFLKSFMTTAKPKFVKFYEDNVKGDAVDEVERMRKIALNTASIGGFGVDATYWFAEITKKINMLKKVDDYLASSIITGVHDIKDSIYNKMMFILGASILALLVLMFMTRLITLRITNSLKVFKEGLGFFFAYAVREKDYLKPMKVRGTDEFAQMTAEMNKQIEKTEYIIEKDKKVVLEIDDAMAKVKNGFFAYTIKEEGASKEVEALRNNINEMLKETKGKLDLINGVLDEYSAGNYSFELSLDKKKGMNGDMGSLVTSSMLLGSSSSQLLAMISNAGSELNSSTHVLTSSSQNLSTASNAQAASLEETAAAIEEITANIQNSSSSMSQMSSLADELNSTAKVGESLASKTATSMDEINEKVSAINEAITVIDQIAFQTNILSLNAAVEAATAGEAGKGFAVVAQEVRNLAARSAEAAKDIKNLVEDATTKSQVGKDTSVKMIDGYTSLNEKVIQTKEMIDTVSSASKEQEIGMIQINDAINSLDKATQENASTASSIDNLASEVSRLSERLISITSRANFDEQNKRRVHDVDFVQEIAKYKNDHIKFKDTNFAKLDSRENWSVTDSNSCNLGKWIVSCENENRDFTNSSTWNSMKEIHSHLHNQVQVLVTKNSEGISVDEVESISNDIEESTYKIFEKLDDLLEVHCNNIK